LVLQHYAALRREVRSEPKEHEEEGRVRRTAGANSFTVTGRELRDRSGCVERQRQERLHRPQDVNAAIARRSQANSRAATSAEYRLWIDAVESTYDVMTKYFVGETIHAANRRLNRNGRQHALSELAREFVEYMKANRTVGHFRTAPALQPVRCRSIPFAAFHSYSSADWRAGSDCVSRMQRKSGRS
jgi:hypothetical protein